MSAALGHLAAADPDLAALIGRIGPCRLSVIPREPYEGLVRAICHQQLHARAAEAILGRVMAHFPGQPFPPPEAVLGAEAAALRACGLSGGKLAAIRAIAAGALDGTIPDAAGAAALDDEALIARLVGLRGVGRWTVEMLLMFNLGRPDVLPVDDFGVRDGWRHIKRLAAPPRPRALADIGRAWAPFRSTAAWYLWRASEEAKAARSPPAGRRSHR